MEKILIRYFLKKKKRKNSFKTITIIIIIIKNASEYKENSRPLECSHNITMAIIGNFNSGQSLIDDAWKIFTVVEDMQHNCMDRLLVDQHTAYIAHIESTAVGSV